ncbi:MAG: hydrogenase maturation nickel metallochaperone HypA [bacterium]
MHELSVTAELLNTVLTEACRHGVRSVSRVTVVVGDLTGIDPQCLRYYFSVLSRGTVPDRAELVVESQATLFYCQPCAKVFPRKRDCFSCPDCGKQGSVLREGMDLYLESMEVE